MGDSVALGLAQLRSTLRKLSALDVEASSSGSSSPRSPRYIEVSDAIPSAQRLLVHRFDRDYYEKPSHELRTLARDSSIEHLSLPTTLADDFPARAKQPVVGRDTLGLGQRMRLAPQASPTVEQEINAYIRDAQGPQTSSAFGFPPSSSSSSGARRARWPRRQSGIPGSATVHSTSIRSAWTPQRQENAEKAGNGYEAFRELAPEHRGGDAVDTCTSSPEKGYVFSSVEERVNRLLHNLEGHSDVLRKRAPPVDESVSKHEMATPSQAAITTSPRSGPEVSKTIQYSDGFAVGHGCIEPPEISWQLSASGQRPLSGGHVVASESPEYTRVPHGNRQQSVLSDHAAGLIRQSPAEKANRSERHSEVADLPGAKPSPPPVSTIPHEADLSSFTRSRHLRRSSSQEPRAPTRIPQPHPYPKAKRALSSNPQQSTAGSLERYLPGDNRRRAKDDPHSQPASRQSSSSSSSKVAGSYVSSTVSTKASLSVPHGRSRVQTPPPPSSLPRARTPLQRQAARQATTQLGSTGRTSEQNAGRREQHQASARNSDFFLSADAQANSDQVDSGSTQVGCKSAMLCSKAVANPRGACASARRSSRQNPARSTSSTTGPVSLSRRSVSRRGHDHTGSSRVLSNRAIAGQESLVSDPYVCDDAPDLDSASVRTLGDQRSIGMSPPQFPESEAGRPYMGFKNKRGERHGYGVLRGKDGTVYTGQWSDGRRHGHGSVFFEGGVFEGEWVGGKVHGNGTVYFKNGDVFEGLYVGSQKCGPGTYRWADGAEEIGNYVEGCKDGWHEWHHGADKWHLLYNRGAVLAANRADVGQGSNGHGRPSDSCGQVAKRENTHHGTSHVHGQKAGLTGCARPPWGSSTSARTLLTKPGNASSIHASPHVGGSNSRLQSTKKVVKDDGRETRRSSHAASSRTRTPSPSTAASPEHSECDLASCNAHPVAFCDNSTRNDTAMRVASGLRGRQRSLPHL